MADSLDPAEYLDEDVQKALDSAKEKVLGTDKDFPLLVTGEEGDGKSTLALVMAAYWDPEFTVERQVCLNWESVIRAADQVPDGSALVFDEGINALLSRNHGTKPNKTFLQWIREVRAKNLFLIICMPEWKEVDKPVRDDRAKALIQIKDQGWAWFYDEDKTDEITVDKRYGKKQVEFPDPLFTAGWKDLTGTDLWEEYMALKKEKVDNLSDKYLDGVDESDGEDRENLLTVAEVGDWLNLSDKTVHRWIRDGKMDAVKLPTGQYRIPESEIGEMV